MLLALNSPGGPCSENGRLRWFELVMSVMFTTSTPSQNFKCDRSHQDKRKRCHNHVVSHTVFSFLKSHTRWIGLRWLSLLSSSGSDDLQWLHCTGLIDVNDCVELTGESGF